MTRKSATLTILLGGLFMSFVGLIMRLIVDATGFQILFYRSLTISLVVIIFSCIITKSNPLVFLKKLDKFDLTMGVSLSLAFATYVFYIKYYTIFSCYYCLALVE